MAANSLSPSRDGSVLTVPAEYSDDFRSAVVGEILSQSKHVRDDIKKATEMELFGHDDEAAARQEDVRHSMVLLGADTALYQRVIRQMAG
jgi:hypothetical protein